MNKLITKYLAANFIMPFTVSTIFFVTFLLTFQLFRITDLIVSKGLSIAYTLKLFGHIAITFLPMAVPLSALFATIFTVNKLCNDNEYVALRSFGVKKQFIIKPFIVVALFIAVVIYNLNQNIIPYSKSETNKAISNLKSSNFLADIKSGHFFTSIPNITLFADEVSEDGSELKNIFINVKGTNDRDKTIYANQGKVKKIYDPKDNSESLRLVLTDGNLINFFEDNKSEKIIFKKYNFPIMDRSNLGFQIQKAGMMSGDRLKKVLKMDRYTRINKIYLDDDDFIRAKIEYWNRFNTPFQVLVFCIIGFVLGVKDNRGSNKKSGRNLLFILGYYVVFFGLISMARKEKIPVQVAVFLPTFLLLLVSTRLYQKLDWTS